MKVNGNVSGIGIDFDFDFGCREATAAAATEAALVCEDVGACGEMHGMREE